VGRGILASGKSMKFELKLVGAIHELSLQRKEGLRMVEAYVLIKADPGTAGDIIKAIPAISGVKSARAVTGPYDIIALVEAADFNALGSLVVARIQKITGVRETTTCITVELG